jgi:hypothetical protein
VLSLALLLLLLLAPLSTLMVNARSSMVGRIRGIINIATAFRQVSFDAFLRVLRLSTFGKFGRACASTEPELISSLNTLNVFRSRVLVCLPAATSVCGLQRATLIWR